MCSVSYYPLPMCLLKLAENMYKKKKIKKISVNSHENFHEIPIFVDLHTGRYCYMKSIQ